MLERYAQIFPELPRIIINRYEAQSEHRQSLERRVVDSNIAREKTGQWMAFVVVMTTISGGIFLIYSGRDASGITAIVTAVTGLAATFIYDKWSRKKEREQKMTAVVKSR
ncbi:MAG: DUF2335 domain-containing protein [Acidobacteria bacterium]|nr:DUF2335 domain-containing protein [Acidobacteriota bacterium]